MSESTEERPARSPGYVWRPWKIVAVVCGLLLAIAGGALMLTGEGDEETPAMTLTAGGGEDRPSATASSDTVPPGGPGAESLLPGRTPPMPGPGSTPDATPGGETAVVSAGEDTVPSSRDDGDLTLSPALLRGGISFLAAFAVGYAFRMFVRIALFFAGLWAISLFVLAQAGWLTVHWQEIDVAFRAWVSGLGDEFASFGQFVTGSLPSAGLAGMGLYTGLRRG